MIGGRIGEVLNRDIGALVKDAGKVLNADLGELVRARKAVADQAPAPALPQVEDDVTDISTLMEPSAVKERLHGNLVVRHHHPMPSGTDVAVLLPHTVGDFVRHKFMPAGQIASDPVSAAYGAVTPGAEDEVIYITLTQCWDRLEAIERIASTKPNLTRGTRVAPDGTWIAGRMEAGIALAWTRENYCYTVHAPAGVSSLAKFLKAFPY